MKIKRYFLLTLFILGSIGTIYSQKSSNEVLSENEHLVLATNWFQKSAEMRACFYQTYQYAKLKLEQNLTHYKGNKPTAVVIDIDETILDNSPYEVYLIRTGESFTNENWLEWSRKAEAKALPGALDFANFVASKGVELFYISNRKENELTSTFHNLKNENFPFVDSVHVVLRKLNTPGDKTARRNKIMETYEVLLYVGDNLTDFSEIFAHRGDDLGFTLVDSVFKQMDHKFIILPNPIYGEWENAIYKNNLKIPASEKRALRKEILDGYSQ